MKYIWGTRAVPILLYSFMNKAQKYCNDANTLYIQY